MLERELRGRPGRDSGSSKVTGWSNGFMDMNPFSRHRAEITHPARRRFGGNAHTSRSRAWLLRGFVAWRLCWGGVEDRRCRDGAGVVARACGVPNSVHDWPGGESSPSVASVSVRTSGRAVGQVRQRRRASASSLARSAVSRPRLPRARRAAVVPPAASRRPRRLRSDRRRVRRVKGSEIVSCASAAGRQFGSASFVNAVVRKRWVQASAWQRVSAKTIGMPG